MLLGFCSVDCNRAKFYIHLQYPVYFVVVIAKKYLYHCLYKEVMPTFGEFLSNIDYIKMMEKEIAQKNSKFDIWYKKWKPLLYPPPRMFILCL